MNPLARVTERVNRLGDPNDPATPRPLLTLEEFFEGNDVVGSIGCNLSPPPGPADFFNLLRSINARDDVKDVRVKIYAFDDPAWPFSETVYIMTSASLDEVASWFPEDLAPDDFWEGFPADEVYEPYNIPAGTRPVGCWWD